MPITPYQQSTSRNLSARQKLIREVRLSLGEGMIKIELLPDHYEMAFDMALDRYRERSSNSVEERVGVLDLIEDQDDYYLPDEVIEVRELYRRGITGSSTGTGSNFDPFSMAFASSFVFGRMGGGLGTGPLGGGVAGDLITYELAMEYQTMLGRMFGAQIDFIWNTASKRLSLQRSIRGPEAILMLLYVYRPEEILLKDTYARPWLRDYTIAKCKLFLGEARSKYGSLPSPQGGMTLNGDTIKQEALAELERLEKEVSTQIEQNQGYGLTWG